METYKIAFQKWLLSLLTLFNWLRMVNEVLKKVEATTRPFKVENVKGAFNQQLR